MSIAKHLYFLGKRKVSQLQDKRKHLVSVYQWPFQKKFKKVGGFREKDSSSSSSSTSSSSSICNDSSSSSNIASSSSPSIVVESLPEQIPPQHKNEKPSNQTFSPSSPSPEIEVIDIDAIDHPGPTPAVDPTTTTTTTTTTTSNNGFKKGNTFGGKRKKSQDYYFSL